VTVINVTEFTSLQWAHRNISMTMTAVRHPWAGTTTNYKVTVTKMKILSLFQMQNRGYTDLSPPTMYRAALPTGMFLLAPPGGRRSCRQTTKIQIERKHPLTNMESYKIDMSQRPAGWNLNNPGHRTFLSVTQAPPRCTP
jgi:hypothetical protein